MGRPGAGRGPELIGINPPADEGFSMEVPVHRRSVMPSSIRMPLGPWPRTAFPQPLRPGIGARLARFPWRRATSLACLSAMLGASMWWVWW